MLTEKYHLVFLILSIHTPTSLRRISKFRKPEKNHIIYFSSLKAKPYSEMNSDAEGAKRFEVSSTTIHFASSLVLELLLFPHSIPVPLTLHFISFVNPEVYYLPHVCPPLRSRGQASCFSQHDRKSYSHAQKKITPRIFSPGFFLFLVHHHIIAIIIYVKFCSLCIFYHILAYLCDEILFQ